MVETHAHFDQRLKKLGRKHEEMTDGYVAKVGSDGLIRVEPRRTRRARNWNGVPYILTFVIGFFCLKALMLSAIGPDGYAERLGKLKDGTVVEQAGAVALSADPVTVFLADQLGPLFR